VVTLSAVYADAVLGFSRTDTMTLIFLVNIAAALGAFAFGYWQDQAGHKRALAVTLLGWIVTTVLAAAATGPGLFWCAATLAGLCIGSSQSAARTLVGLLAPPARLAEFFGLWTWATRLAAVAGPVSYGLVNWLSGGNHRLAIAFTGGFFVLGLVLLKPLDLQRGKAAAEAAA
jgi:UMF1 family MFS transporter